MRAAVICNHPMGLPLIEGLAQQGVLTGLGTCPPETSTTARLRMVATQLNVPNVELSSTDAAAGFARLLEESKPEVVLVLGLSVKVPEAVLGVPQLGFLNFHPGLLPKYRGPQPVFWQIRKGDAVGGVTVHLMDKGWDTGGIVHIEKEPIGAFDSLGSYSYKLAGTVMRAASAVLPKIAVQGGSLEGRPQDESQAEYQKRPQAADLAIDWEGEEAQSIHSLTRAANPQFGGSVFFYKGVEMRLVQSTVASIAKPPKEKPGTVIKASPASGIEVLCRDGRLIRADVVSSDLGVASGARLVDWFGVKAGDVFESAVVSPRAG